jgi:uncharacterized coiled-coil protein SlyX
MPRQTYFDTADRAVARGLASLHHQEAHRAPQAPAATFEDEPPEADPTLQSNAIARLQRALAAQSQTIRVLSDRIDALGTTQQVTRITELETRAADAVRDLAKRVADLEDALAEKQAPA